METIFKEKDRVFHIYYGWGNVISVSDIFIGIKLENKEEVVFNYCRCLISFTEYKLDGFTQERPEILPEKGQIVWVRSFDDAEWIIAKFIVKSAEGRYICTHGNPYTNPGIQWKFITTIDPYKNEK